MTLRVVAKNGSSVWQHENDYRGRGNNFVYDVQGLLPGLYRIEAQSPSSGHLAAEFEVLDLDPAPHITLEF
jgi:hypothetical protein